MNNTIPDPAKPIGNVTIVQDFLLPREQLVPKKNTVRVTMEFTKESIEFLKREAQRHNASYQAMIRNLVDAYVRQQQQ
jgi:predicted DNA binding CopG/RHH family protein